MKEFFEWLSGKSLSIILSQVDPDALGSAFGLKAILERFDVSSKIFYANSLSHPQNRAIINYYNVQSHLFKICKDVDVGEFCLVDSQSLEDARLPFHLEEKDLRIVVDHHRGGVRERLAPLEEKSFVLVDEVGAASTLVIELMRDLDITLEEEERWIYSLLALGIYTDTKSLIASSNRDHMAFATAKKFIEVEDLGRFINYTLPSSFFKNINSATRSFYQRGSRAVCHLGFINEKDRDDISSIADLFLRREGVDFIAVTAIVDDYVHISFRNKNISDPLDVFIEEKFSGLGGAKLSPGGRGEGGVKIELNMGFWKTEENSDLIVNLVRGKIDEILFKGGE